MGGTMTVVRGQSLFRHACQRLLSGERPWAKSDGFNSSGSESNQAEGSGDEASKSRRWPRASPDEERWFADLLCLPVEAAALVQPLSSANLSRAVLFDTKPNSTGEKIRGNIQKLWTHALQAWARSDESRRLNGLRIVMHLSDILLSEFSSSLNIISLLCASISTADSDLVQLVDTIKISLSRCLPISFQEWTEDAEELRSELLLTLNLLLIWTARAGQTSLASAFFQRDLFPPLSAILSAISSSAWDVAASSQTTRTAETAAAAQELKVKTSLCLALLATCSLPTTRRVTEIDFHLLFSGNPYARRIADWVDLAAMKTICSAASHAWQDTVKRMVKRNEGNRAANGLGGLFSLFGAMNSPKGKAREVNDIPAPETSILLPVLLLTNLNGAFVSTLISSESSRSTEKCKHGQPAHLSLLSLSTFLHCEASSQGARSASLARASLATLFYLVRTTKPETLLRPITSGELAKLSLCQHRHAGGVVSGASLSSSSSSTSSSAVAGVNRPEAQTTIHLVLLSACTYLKNNLSKRLDGEGYVTALRTICECFNLLASTRAMLDLDWSSLWLAILSVASFLSSRLAEMEQQYRPSTRVAGRELFSTLSAALLLSDRYLPSPGHTHLLIYEIVRSAKRLRKLAWVLLSPLFDDKAGQSSKGSADGADLINSTGNHAPSSPSPLADSPLPQRVYVELPGWKVLELVMNTVEAKLEDLAAPRDTTKGGNASPRKPGVGVSPGLIEVETVLSVISRMDLDTLLAGASMDDLQMAPRCGSMRSTSGYRDKMYGSLRNSGSAAATSLPAGSGGGGAGVGLNGGGLMDIVKVCAAEALRLL